MSCVIRLSHSRARCPDEGRSVMATKAVTSTSFPSPFEVPIPPGCEGWQEMYPYHMAFSDDRRAFDESRFWFQDGCTTPSPFTRSTQRRWMPHLSV